jgi:putative oxidoreductase
MHLKEQSTMQAATMDRRKDAVILLARILLMILYIPAGWDKMIHFGGTVGFMGQLGLPLPLLAAIIAVVMELPVAIAIVVGIYTGPLAVLQAIYTLAAGFIGHHYWTMADPERTANMINFYKNVSICGGLLLLWVTGAGKYSVDKR